MHRSKSEWTDPYCARFRVLEYLNRVESRMPATAKTSLGA